MAAGPTRVNSVFEDAVAVWHFREARDAAGADSVLTADGNVKFGVALEGEEHNASIVRGGDGYAAEFRGGYCLAGQGAGSELNLGGTTMTMLIRLRDPSGKWDTSLFSKHGGHNRLVYNLFAADLGGGMLLGFELGIAGEAGMHQVTVPVRKIGPAAWHDVVARYDGEHLALFIDGLCVDEKAMRGELRQGNTEPCVIGGESMWGQVRRPFHGFMDHAAIWGRALTDEEIIAVSGGREAAEQRRIALETEEKRLKEAAVAVHKELLAKADASVAKARSKAELDPLRPIYHLMTAANWINDPNGPIFFDGRYHMFFQHNPYGEQWGNMSWGHAVSTDLAHWEHWPIALTPNPDLYDAGGIFSGCCVINEGVPTIVYTGVSPEVQCIATSTDGMRTWTKSLDNPVIPKRPREDLQGFRDPFVWKEADGWYLVVGSGINGQGGAALLYRSPDLIHWEYLHPLCVDFGKNWECPNFFPLGDKHVLIVSPHGAVRYAIGVYADHRFDPEEWRVLDPGTFYAPNCLLDPSGRRILWGWITGGGTKDYPWNGCLTLPRVLALRADGRLGMTPAPELEQLRGKHWEFRDVAISPETPFVPDGVWGDCLEIQAVFERCNADAFGIELRRSPDGAEKTAVAYDNVAQRLAAGDRIGDFQILRGEEMLDVRIFLDKSVIEVYANGRACITARTYPTREDACGVSVFARGENARLRSLDVWEMGTIW